jgi:DNA-binding NtrC family response regulator
VTVSLKETSETLSIVCNGGAPPAARQTPTILIVDDNHDLLFFIAGELKEQGWEILIAENGAQARLAFYQRRPEVVLLDYMLGEDDGLKLGLEFQTQAPLTHVILMTGGGFSDDMQAVWEELDLTVLYKPFLAQDVINLVRGRISKASAVVGAS